MKTLDLSPLYRSSIGFDQLASLLNSTFLNDNTVDGYPPYNIEVIGDSEYEITLAVSGFSDGDIEIQVENKILTIRGQKPEGDIEKNYIHKGIAARKFERKFNLADYVEVTKANLSDGLLTIRLVREIPEVMKPRKIDINSADHVLKSEKSSKKAA